MSKLEAIVKLINRVRETVDMQVLYQSTNSALKQNDMGAFVDNLIELLTYGDFEAARSFLDAHPDFN